MNKWIMNKWDERFMFLAKEISSWSKDPSTKIGVVIVNDERRILSTGYNGFPKGIEDTEERLSNRSLKYPLIVHGEMNALMSALYNGVSVKGSTMYVYGLPVCSECCKNIIQSGIKCVVIDNIEFAPEIWAEQWKKTSEPMFKEAGVEVKYFSRHK